MVALAAERNSKRYGIGPEPEVLALPVAASTKIWKGSIVCDNGSGYAIPGSTATTQIAMGRAKETIDNSSGSAGDKTVEAERGAFRYGNSAAADEITIAERGSECWIVDDQTVAKTSGSSTRSRAGIVIDVDDYGVYVLLGSALFYDLATLNTVVSAHTTHLINAAASVSISLYDVREVDASGDVGNLAAHGGILASDSTPALSGDANESQILTWVTSNADPIAFQLTLPSDFNDAGDAALELVVSSGGTTDAATFTVETSWDGGSQVTDTATDGSPSTTPKVITATIANADIATGANRVTVALTPAAHATDTILLHGIRLKYTREYLT